MEANGISLLVPTRNRPNGMRRLVESVWKTAVGAVGSDVEMIFYVDDDDPTRDETLRLILDNGGSWVGGERIVLSKMWNACYERATRDVIMQCADDIVFRSMNWNETVLAEFDASSDKIILVHGRDGFQDANLATHGFYHRRWIEAVGYFMPPYFSSDYNDLWWTEVADQLGRRVYLPTVYTEHMHPVAGKGELDLTHRERLARHNRDRVDELYVQLSEQRAADVQKLRTAITAAYYDEHDTSADMHDGEWVDLEAT